MVWATLNILQPSTHKEWRDEKGNEVKWIRPEHTFLLIGYSDTDAIVNDCNDGKMKSYPLNIFKDRWESMGKQAVTVSEKIKGKVVTTYIRKSLPKSISN